jgi:hypothetical protein
MEDAEGIAFQDDDFFAPVAVRWGGEERRGSDNQIGEMFLGPGGGFSDWIPSRIRCVGQTAVAR